MSLLFVSCGDQEKEITVQSIAISQPSAEMQIGETLLLKASVAPSNANFNGLNWTSTMPKVASVSSSGLVTALSEGNTTITVMAGGKTASCNIKVLKGTIAVSSISLDNTSLEMVEGETATLTASVSPPDATDKTITWNSSNTSIATVDDSGKVTAVKEGTATINAKAGDKTAQCVVNVQKQSGGIEAVDLGLSVKWASCNVGASMPEEYGDYFAWGETEPYYSSLNPMTWMNGKEKGYLWSSYKWCIGLMRTLTKYCNDSASGYNGFTDTRTVLDLDDDAAYVNLREKWRMPTDAEWTELREKCTWTWTRQNGVLGYKVTGHNGKYIFLPEAGFLSSTILYEVGSRGCYWSSSLNVGDSNSAWYLLFFNSDDVKRSYDIRYNGLSVRPVFGDPRSESVPVSGISLNMTGLTLEVGQSATLTATVSPSNATDKTVTWTSSNTTVSTVSSNGTVTAKAVGTATITAKAGDKTASCTLTVISSIIEVSSITLDKTSISLKEGESVTLVATVKPDNATDKTIVWKSSDEGTATVDANGTVTGVHEGNAVVSASAGGKTAQCSISVGQDPSDYSVPDAVDLGLPSGLKWASFNVGASRPWESGGYFAWGDTETYYYLDEFYTRHWKEGKNKGYCEENYKWFVMISEIANRYKVVKYCPADGARYWGGTGEPDDKTEFKDYNYEDDAARRLLGGKWRTPTQAEWEELRENCHMSVVGEYGVTGFRVTGQNGNSIFFPTSGLIQDKTLDGKPYEGCYWSSTIYSFIPTCAMYMYFHHDGSYHWTSLNALNRCCGLLIRAVIE